MSHNSAKQTRFAWFVVVLLAAGAALNYIDRSVLGVIMPQVRRDLSLTNADFASAVNAFLVMYTVFYILGGRLADRLGCRRTFALTVVFWSIACMAHAWVRGLRSLALCRAILGVGEGSFYPTAMRGAADWFPPETRAKAVGLMLFSSSMGNLITPPLGAWIALHYGWRACFLVTGALGFLLVPPWLLLYRRIHRLYGAYIPAPAERPERPTGAPPEDDLAISEVLRTPKYWCVLTARACADAAWYFYVFWISGYFQDVRGLDLASVGRFLWIPFFTAGVGALAGSWASSALVQRRWSVNRSRKTVLLASAFCGVVGASACFVPTASLAVALVGLALLGHQSWSANIQTVITEITPPKHVAALYGMTGAAGTLLGAAAQFVIGRVIDSSGYTPAFVWAGGMYALGAMLLLAAGPIERIRRKVGVVPKAYSLPRPGI